MASLNWQPTTTNYDETLGGNYGILPDGTYRVVCTRAQMKAPKNGGPDYLELELKVDGGEYDGRLSYQKFGIGSEKEDARATANRLLTQFVLATNALNGHPLSDPEQLVGARCTVDARVKAAPAGSQYGPSNTFTYKPLNGAEQGKAAPAQAGQATGKKWG